MGVTINAPTYDALNLSGVIRLRYSTQNSTKMAMAKQSVFHTFLQTLLFVVLLLPSCKAYTSGNRSMSRRGSLERMIKGTPTFLVAFEVGKQASIAFDGTGSSAYSGRTPASKSELLKGYKDRVTADVRDFNALGKAIDRGETDGDAWVNFFIEFQRREPDSVGRTYAGLVDLIGIKDVSGCGILLASSFTKPGKPSEGTPAVKQFNSIAKVFEPIKAAGKKGDAVKAKAAWVKAGDSLSKYLEVVDLPSNLADPIYA